MWCPEDNMADYSHILFNKSPLQLCQVGARGGKAYGRKQRARRALIALMPKPPEATPVRPPRQTTAEAVALLDAQFPWLFTPAAPPVRANTPNRAAARTGTPGNRRMRTRLKTRCAEDHGH